MNIIKLLAFVAFISFVLLQIAGEKVDAWLPACWSFGVLFLAD